MKLRDKKGRFVSKYATLATKVHESQILLSNTMSIQRKTYQVTGGINDNTK